MFFQCLWLLRMPFFRPVCQDQTFGQERETNRKEKENLGQNGKPESLLQWKLCIPGRTGAAKGNIQAQLPCQFTNCKEMQLNKKNLDWTYQFSLWLILQRLPCNISLDKPWIWADPISSRDITRCKSVISYFRLLFMSVSLIIICFSVKLKTTQKLLNQLYKTKHYLEQFHVSLSIES